MVLVFCSVWEDARNQVHKKVSSENIYLKACSASFSRVQSASFLISTLISILPPPHLHLNTQKVEVKQGEFSPGGASRKKPSCQCRDTSSISGLGRFPGEGHGKPLRYSCLENLMGRGSWWATFHGVTKSQTRLGQLSTHTHFLVYNHLKK